MTGRTLERRIDALEGHAGSHVGKVHRLLVPDGLEGDALDAWKAEATRGFGPNDVVILRFFVDPQAQPEAGA